MGLQLKMGGGVVLETISHPDVNQEEVYKHVPIHKWEVGNVTWFLLKLWDFFDEKSSLDGRVPYMIIGQRIHRWENKTSFSAIKATAGRVVSLPKDSDVSLVLPEDNFTLKDSILFPRFLFIDFLTENMRWFHAQYVESVLEPLGLTSDDFSLLDECSSDKSPIGYCRYDDDGKCAYCKKIEELPF